MFTGVNLCICMHVEARGQPGASLSHLSCFLRQDLSLGTRVYQLALATQPESPRDLPISTLPVLRLQVHADKP